MMIFSIVRAQRSGCRKEPDETPAFIVRLLQHAFPVIIAKSLFDVSRPQVVILLFSALLDANVRPVVELYGWIG